MTKLIILDRDGVINQDSDLYVRSVDEWIPIEGSIQAIADLSRNGYKIAVATNQSGLARGYFSLATLDAMHQKMTQLVTDAGGRVDAIFYCPHGPDDACLCRKPLPGMIHQILQHFGPLQETPWLIGDSLRDLEAAWAVDNIHTALVKTGKGERTLAKTILPEHTQVHNNLESFAQWLLAQ